MTGVSSLIHSSVNALVRPSIQDRQAVAYAIVQWLIKTPKRGKDNELKLAMDAMAKRVQHMVGFIQLRLTSTGVVVDVMHPEALATLTELSYGGRWFLGDPHIDRRIKNVILSGVDNP